VWLLKPAATGGRLQSPAPCPFLWRLESGLKVLTLSWSWWFMPVIAALRKLRQEDREFGAILGYVTSSGQPGLHSEALSQKRVPALEFCLVSPGIMSVLKLPTTPSHQSSHWHIKYTLVPTRDSTGARNQSQRPNKIIILPYINIQSLHWKFSFHNLYLTKNNQNYNIQLIHFFLETGRVQCLDIIGTNKKNTKQMNKWI
jgi:hypothetical protein